MTSAARTQPAVGTSQALALAIDALEAIADTARTQLYNEGNRRAFKGGKVPVRLAATEALEAIAIRCGPAARVAVEASGSEWRVLTFHPTDDEPLVCECDNAAAAAGWAELERNDYPRARVVVQRRTVGPWQDQRLPRS